MSDHEQGPSPEDTPPEPPPLPGAPPADWAIEPGLSPTPSPEPVIDLDAPLEEPAVPSLLPPGFEPGARPEPVQPKERLIALDVLRGMAVFGILAVNMESFAMITTARRNPDLGGGEGPLNYAVWLMTYVMADTKFIAIFSMLFGAGIAMMYQKRRDEGKHGILAYYRRMAMLMALGWLHAHYIWDGDILWFYGVYGLFLYWVAGAPGWLLILAGTFGVAIDGFIWGWPHAPQHYGRAVYEIMAYRGDYAQQQAWRWQEAYYMETQATVQFALQGMGYMMIGMGLFKGRVITGQRPWWAYLAVALVAFPAGIALIGIPSNWGRDFSPTEIISVWNLPELGGAFSAVSPVERFVRQVWDGDLLWEPAGASFVAGSFLVALGWICSAMLLAKWFPAGLFTRALGAVGRMALTNYLMHSVICTFIFYGHGLGLYAKLDRTHQAGIVVAIWIGQLILSPLWFRWFRFGPVEWAWRSVTYWRLQPVLKRDRPAPPSEPIFVGPPLPWDYEDVPAEIDGDEPADEERTDVGESEDGGDTLRGDQ